MISSRTSLLTALFALSACEGINSGQPQTDEVVSNQAALTLPSTAVRVTSVTATTVTTSVRVVDVNPAKQVGSPTSTLGGGQTTPTSSSATETGKVTTLSGQLHGWEQALGPGAGQGEVNTGLGIVGQDKTDLEQELKDRVVLIVRSRWADTYYGIRINGTYGSGFIDLGHGAPNSYDTNFAGSGSDYAATTFRVDAETDQSTIVTSVSSPSGGFVTTESDPNGDVHCQETDDKGKTVLTIDYSQAKDTTTVTVPQAKGTGPITFTGKPVQTCWMPREDDDGPAGSITLVTGGASTIASQIVHGMRPLNTADGKELRVNTWSRLSSTAIESQVGSADKPMPEQTGGSISYEEMLKANGWTDPSAR